jgi:CheY-like chemotaxis protein
VRLPALDGGARPDASPVHPSVPASASTHRVLVVEDNPDAADSLRSLLELLGHEVRQAGDGATAIAAVQSCAPDLVFMDIGLPGMNGLEATRRIRELPLAKQPLIVALTGWGQDTDRERSQFAGVDQHLVKPIDHEALRSVLELAEQAG